MPGYSDWVEFKNGNNFVTERYYTGSVDTSATAISLTGNSFKGIRVINVNNDPSKILYFSIDDGQNWFTVPTMYERTEILHGTTLHIKGAVSDVDYEVFVLESI